MHGSQIFQQIMNKDFSFKVFTLRRRRFSSIVFVDGFIFESVNQVSAGVVADAGDEWVRSETIVFVRGQDLKRDVKSQVGCLLSCPQSDRTRAPRKLEVSVGIRELRSPFPENSHFTVSACWFRAPDKAKRCARATSRRDLEEISCSQARLQWEIV